MIPGCKLFTFTGSLLFHFFKVVKRRTRGFCLFYNGFRLHNRLLFNRLRLLVQRLLSDWLLISLLSLVCRLWSKSGLLLFGLPGVTCHRLFWRRGVIRLLRRLFRRSCIIRLLNRLFRRRRIIRLLWLYRLLQRLIILHCRLRILWLLWVTFRCRSNHRLSRLWPRYRLPGYCRLCRCNINRGNRWRLSHRFNRCSPALRRRGSSSCYSNRFGNWRTV